MTVYKESLFPASRQEIFTKLQKLSTLQYIARPYATFTPVDAKVDMIWEPGEIFVFRFRLFGLIPFGTHTIHVLEFDENSIYTHETNTHVPVWNHRIRLKQTGNGSTLYSDEVEIDAGWKTPFIYCCAKAFMIIDNVNGAYFYRIIRFYNPTLTVLLCFFQCRYILTFNVQDRPYRTIP